MWWCWTGSARSRACAEATYSTRNVTRRLTRHSVISPLPLVTTLVSFTQAPWMPLTVNLPDREPRRPVLQVSPSTSPEVGSPTMQ
ncbi:hypothetical protein G6F24_017592 [Rhizopus arrhizus]|nr:hypothetical protein G6F24_017592 [Rhizopus arrhizus]